MGMLQFRIRHNLQDDSCVARNDCFYAIEEEDQTAAWLAQIAADSDLAVLHWDRAVPWLAFEACVGPPGPPAYPDPDPLTCYPLDLSAITDLDQGDRLEILALSFYPDNLLMAVSENDNLLYAYPEDWDETSACLMRAQLPPFLDPVAALDRFNWSKPVAIAELGARSCRSFQFIDDGINRFIIRPAGDPTSQAFWLDHFLESAGQRKFEFYVQVSRDDYDPIGLWAERQGVLPENLYNVNNIFPCMGLYDDNGQVKDGITAIWQDALP